jgi:hypothetical protein
MAGTISVGVSVETAGNVLVTLSFWVGWLSGLPFPPAPVQEAINIQIRTDKIFFFICPFVSS